MTNTNIYTGGTANPRLMFNSQTEFCFMVRDVIGAGRGCNFAKLYRTSINEIYQVIKYLCDKII